MNNDPLRRGRSFDAGASALAQDDIWRQQSAETERDSWSVPLSHSRDIIILNSELRIAFPCCTIALQSETERMNMFIYEKDYIMRMIYGITQMLAVILFGKKLNSEEVFIALGDEFRGSNDLLLEMVDKGEINAAEDRLFDIIETSGMAKDALGLLILQFYDHVNSKDDEFLAKAEFDREEILPGLKDAMSRIGLDVSEYTNI